MKIDDSNSGRIIFASLGVSDVFSFTGNSHEDTRFCIKTIEHPSTGTNAVDLVRGTFVTVRLDFIVTPVAGKFVCE